MFSDLQGKVAIVTGASKGIGRAIALRYGQEQMRVVVNYNRELDAALSVVSEIEHAGGDAIAVQADVSGEADVQRLIQTAFDAYGSLHVMVNNAGIQSTFPSHKLTLEEWNNIVAVNLTGTFLGCREAIKCMLEHRIAGSVINISSVHQKIPKPQHAHYAASKGGTKLLTETLALEYAAQGIRINTIAPGAIRTPMNEDILADPSQLQKVVSRIPMGMIGEPEQVAAAAAWLASREAAYVTGVTLFVDGGMTLE